MHGETHGNEGRHQTLLYGIIGILVGILIGLWVGGYAVNKQEAGMLRMMGISGTTAGMMGHGGSGMGMSMDDMMSELNTNTGSERDEQFLRMMIVHHQGAIAMAESVKETTERQELKDMADDIIRAQSTEIDQMQQWLKDWFGADVSLQRPAGVSTQEHEAHHS